MARRILVIENTPGVFEPEWPPAFEIDRIAWVSITPEELARRGRDLIVPVVSSFSDTVGAFFRLLLKQGVYAPTLAVLPAEDLHSPECQLAVRTVDDFVMLPIRLEEWRPRVARLLAYEGPDLLDVSERLTREIGLAQLVGRDPAFARVVEMIPVIARRGSPALITGETGTGKELCARAIHMLSGRREQPFIPVDCAALPENLFENEFFGHTRGAFTDAHRDQKGLVGLAESGTLLLDEVDSLSPSAQAKLLRFLQERTYRPLGSERFSRANVNVLAAMNRDPEALTRQGRFRADLFFRLNVIRLHLPPLRERGSDIPLIARHCLASCAKEWGVAPKTLAPSALTKLAAYDWPGNVRELSNVLQYAALLASGRLILPEHIILPGDRADAPPELAESDDGLSFRQVRAMAVETFERAYVSRLIEKHAGNVTRAAREARKDRRAFGRLMKKHNIPSGARQGQPR